MAPETKAEARKKIETLKVGVGYPETWRDYSGLTIRADDPVGNARRATKTEYHHQIAKIGKPVDRGEWWMTPQTVNAVNLPLQNALNFPAAILQAPFYDPKADPRSEEHTSELQSLMRISYAVFCLKKKRKRRKQTQR